jgi:cell division protein FtsQ
MSWLVSAPAPEMLRPPVIRRRRRSRRVPALAWALLRAVVLVSGPVLVASWVLFSPDFLVREVEVMAGSRVSSDWVEASLDPFRGRHLLSVSLTAVRARLSTHPWVDVVEIRKELPDRLRVTVVERVPVALWERASGAAYVDGEGRVIAPFSGDEPSDLLVLSAPSTTSEDRIEAGPALAVAAELAAARPEWAGRIVRLTLLGDGDYRVRVRELGWDLWIRGRDVAVGLSRLDRAREILATLEPPATGIDLRFAERIVIRRGPADGPNPDLRTTSIDETEG